MLKTIVLLACLAFCYGKQIKYTDCGSVSGKISSIDLTPCDVEPCVLHRNTNITVHVKFTSLVNSTSAKTVVHGLIAGVPVPFPVPADCCNNHNLKCPVTAGSNDVYFNNIFCSPQYPKIRLAVKWEVQDDNGKDIMCFVVPLSIDD